MTLQQVMDAVKLHVRQEMQSLSSALRQSAATSNSPLPGSMASGKQFGMQGTG